MGSPHTKVRRHGKVNDLPPAVKAEVDRLLIEGATYEEIADFLRRKGYDISKSSVGRYGKDFFAFYRQVKIVEDQSKILVSDSGGDGLVLEEAAAKIFSKQIIELLLAKRIDLRKVPRIISDFARLQASTVLRERLKAEFRKKAEKIFERAEKGAENMSKEDMLRMLREEIYGLT